MRTLAYVLLLLPAVLPLFGQKTDSKADPKEPTPTVFQADEGDRWMLLGTNRLSSRSIGLPPAHKHLYKDEVIFVHKGAVRVTLAGRRYDARTGATVFIPHGNWIGVENASSDPAMILFFFNKPAFEQCLRAMSSHPGENFTMPPPEKMAGVRQQCHEVMKE